MQIEKTVIYMNNHRIENAFQKLNLYQIVDISKH